MENNLPFVSAIIPCRNEEKFIAKTLESIINQDFPKEKLEVLIVDGQSQDKTREIAGRYIQQNSFLKILENPRKITPAALNVGIKASKGEIIIKMDAHCIYEEDYISKCVKYLLESGAKNVGGVLKTIPAQDAILAKAIAISLSHPFGAGSSYFRTGTDKPRWVDTVAFGCYRKETLKDLGLFDERMEKIEDFELNSRLRKKFGAETILLVPDIVAYYYPSSENLRSFFEHNFSDGVWTTYPLKFGFLMLSFRHLIPLVFVLSLFLTLATSPFFWLSRLFFDLIFGSYLFMNLLFSLKIANKQGLRYFFLMPIVFACRHVGYGLGSLWGFLKISGPDTIKRIFDIIFSFFGLIFVSPILLIVAILIKRESPGPAFYLGERVGRGGKVFKMYKFRSMVLNADKIGGPSTAADDPRLLKIGKVIKKYQLDELPQFINILKGEMSFVGPRPEVPSEVAAYDEETKNIILSVKPGLTDLATLENVHEGEILKGAADPHEAYRRLIQPQKLKLAKEYVKTRSFWLDMKIILKTLKSAIF